MIFMNKYDKWHFILSFLVVYLTALAVDPLLFSYFVKAFPLGVDMRPLFMATGLLIGVLLAAALQGWNESMQALNPKEVENHGGIERFRKNSRLDWKLFVIGAFSGAFVYGLTIAFFL